ncbi:MAG: putative 3-phenylpropionic acid transporter [Devosia sp.]|uniref:MFS transporter n=1 Tax=Devosia sp. TaxID=1871048 RepID=UPI00260FECF3|nr:MFS transporter [Devosia sp.]MDB5588677.1 putative 3-phenylpropionic acid transporter [Devosia sp.]
MALTEVAPRVSPELRTTAFYFTYFMAGGASVVFLPIWLAEKGINPEQTGIINALPIFLIIALNLVVGRIADRASDWRQVIVIGALIAGIIPIGLLWVNEFWGILLVWTLASLPPGAIGPVMDAATMRMTRRNGTDFGTIRAWGTVGYMLLNAGTGFLVVWFGSDIFVPLFIGLVLLRAAVALFLPKFRAPVNEATIGAARPVASKLREVLKPWFLLPLAGFSIIYGTHWILNAFAALLWKQQGISEDIIGPLIALGAFSEAAMMFAWRFFGGRVSARTVLLISAGVTVLRWVAMAFSPPVWLLIPLQMLHGVTFALGYLGGVHFIANWTSEDIAAETQSYFVVAQQAMSVIALVGFGWIVGALGPHGYFVAAAFAAVGALCIWLSKAMVAPKKDALSVN